MATEHNHNSAQQPTHMENFRMDSGASGSSRSAEKERERQEAAKMASYQLRGSRQTYREKYHALRERYDQVNMTNRQIQQDLILADQKQKQLQAEMDLLLDAMDIAFPSETVLQQYYEEPLRPPVLPLAPHQGRHIFYDPPFVLQPEGEPSYAVPYSNGYHHATSHANGHERPSNPELSPDDTPSSLAFDFDYD